jgi:hypothetical protein
MKRLKVVLVLSLGIGLLPAGCSGSSGREGFGMVQGKVTFQNQPVTGGTIHFFQDQEKKASAMIRADGTFSAEVPVGQITVAIETLSGKYQARDAAMKLMKENGYDVDPDQRKVYSPALTAPQMKYVEIPERYNDPERSGLECKVERGQQTCNFDLR